YKAFETNDVNRLKDLLVPDLVAYSHGAPGPQNRDTHLQGIAMWNAAFDGTEFTIEDQIAEGDRVATRTTLSAVHSKGDWQGVPPTGKELEVSGISVERIRDGKIAERRVAGDWLGIMQQLGLVPPPE
ncbi:MAG: ester cyclase, partial [Anaerolineae bacterium]|nr:ester cyclase [Anaerolineae bacterium]